MNGNILIVDDDQGNLLLLSYALRSEQFKIFGALSGAEALKLLEENTFDLVLLDVEMPDMNGLDLAEAFRAALPTAVLGMVTGLFTHDAMFRACCIGVNLYVVKPFNIMTLVNFLKTLDAANFITLPHMTVIDNRSNWRVYECTESPAKSEEVSTSGESGGESATTEELKPAKIDEDVVSEV